MTYSQKLRDPRWQKKRLEILQRDNWKCCSCGATEITLQVHHIYYDRIEPWDYPDEAYQSLCEPCHKNRQEVVDSAVRCFRMQLSKVPTDQLSMFISEALSRRRIPETDDEMFLHHAQDTLAEAFAKSEKSDALLHYGLFSDLIMGLCYAVLFSDKSSCERALDLMSMAEDKMEGVAK